MVTYTVSQMAEIQMVIFLNRIEPNGSYSEVFDIIQVIENSLNIAAMSRFRAVSVCFYSASAIVVSFITIAESINNYAIQNIFFIELAVAPIIACLEFVKEFELLHISGTP